MNNQPCGQSDKSQSADRAALELFQLAALVLSDEGKAVMAVEAGLREAEIDPCADPEGARRIVREKVLAAALQSISAENPEFFLAPASLSEVSSCLEDDDLSSSGISAEQLNDLVQGSGRARMRKWLEQLNPASRAVFVLRAVAGLCNTKTSEFLHANAGPAAAGWTPEAVSAIFRQTLCSLASLLVQSVQISEGVR